MKSMRSEFSPCCHSRLEYMICKDAYVCRKCGKEHPMLDPDADHVMRNPLQKNGEPTDRQRLILELISRQDVRKWDVVVLVAWAGAVADEILKESA